MRKLMLSVSLIAALSVVACENSSPVGPGAVQEGPGTVIVTQTTSSTTTTSTSTSTIAPVLTASFVVSPLTAPVGTQVQVNGSASSPAPGRRIVVYEFDFGDGVKKEGITASHDYDTPATFPIVLTVTDDAGQKAMATKSVTITPGVLIPPPANGQFQFKSTLDPNVVPDVPADLTLLFQLLTGSSSAFLSRTTIIRPMADATYNVAPGSSYLRGDKNGGIVKGQFVGTLTPALNGRFAGSLTFVAGSCSTERVFTGPISADGLAWTAGPLVTPDCSGGQTGIPVAWNYTQVNMVKK